MLILDATFAEESCARASVTVAVSRAIVSGGDTQQQQQQGGGGEEHPFLVCGIYKNGSGHFTHEELLMAINVSDDPCDMCD